MVAVRRRVGGVKLSSQTIVEVKMIQPALDMGQ